MEKGKNNLKYKPVFSTTPIYRLTHYLLRASGSVYKAREKVNNKKNKQHYQDEGEQDSLVAIKQIHLRRQVRKDLIVDEVRMGIENQSHKNMVQHIESYIWKNDVWIVMEYMEGGSLTDIVTQNYMAEREIATVCLEVLRGLDYLHSKGIIHRDIKSDNILIGNQGQIKLCKFLLSQTKIIMPKLPIYTHTTSNYF